MIVLSFIIKVNSSLISKIKVFTLEVFKYYIRYISLYYVIEKIIKFIILETFLEVIKK